jgi:hypothetical protein
MPIRVSLLVARSLACLRVEAEAKKREERGGGSWDTQKRRRRNNSNSEGTHEKRKGRVKLRKLNPPLEC